MAPASAGPATRMRAAGQAAASAVARPSTSRGRGPLGTGVPGHGLTVPRVPGQPPPHFPLARGPLRTGARSRDAGQPGTGHAGDTGGRPGASPGPGQQQEIDTCRPSDEPNARAGPAPGQQPSGEPAAEAQVPGDAGDLAARQRARRTMVPPMPGSAFWGWAGPLLVTALGAFLRFNRLSVPKAVVFDETYYVGDAWAILQHGVEINHVKNANALLAAGSTHILQGTQGELVAHPPLGKMMIAVGEWLFGLTPFGWRFSVALIGSLSILLLARIVRRMTSSTLLGCIAGLLMALDGLELVLSRTAILDIFVMFWVLAAFGLLVIDRDWGRARLAAAAAALRPARLGRPGPARPRARDPLAAGRRGRVPGCRRRVQVERRLVHLRLRRPGPGLGPRRPARGRVPGPPGRGAAQRRQVAAGFLRRGPGRGLHRILEPAGSPRPTATTATAPPSARATTTPPPSWRGCSTTSGCSSSGSA